MKNNKGKAGRPFGKSKNKILLAENRATVERELENQKKAEELARKNNGFTQLDDVGVRSLEKLMEKSVKAGNLFLRLTRQMDSRGAVVASREVLADIAGVDATNVSKLIKLMTEYGLIREAKQGGMRIIAINPEVAWRSWNNGKQYAVFNARVIVSREDLEDTADFDIRRANALIHMAKRAQKREVLKDKRQADFPPPLDPVQIAKTELVD